MALAFYNIGKANALINEQAGRIAELENQVAAKPADDLEPKLAEAIATNAEISEKLTQAGATIATLTAQVDTLSSGAAGVTLALDGALSAAKLTYPADATPLEKIETLKTSVSATLAKLAVPAAAIPTHPPVDGIKTESTGSKTLTMDQFRALKPGERMSFVKSGGKLTE
jgi:hypothetical protein